MEQLVISAEELFALQENPSVRVFDASFHMKASGRDASADFINAHIPGAVRFDIESIADHDTQLPHMLPNAAAFGAAMSALGLRPGDTAVVYDTVGLFSAPRAWWMLRIFGHVKVMVLDGGLPAWKAAGYQLESGPEREYLHSDYVASKNERLVTDRAAVQRAQAAAGQIVDARGAARFTGSAPDPRSGVRAGHIPGSVNVPLTTLHDAAGRVLAPERLREIFAEAGIDTERPIISTCGSGVTACGVALGLALIGARDISIYDGSWSEWGADPALPIERTNNA